MSEQQQDFGTDWEEAERPGTWTERPEKWTERPEKLAEPQVKEAGLLANSRHIEHGLEMNRVNLEHSLNIPEILFLQRLRS